MAQNVIELSPGSVDNQKVCRPQLDVVQADRLDDQAAETVAERLNELDIGFDLRIDENIPLSDVTESDDYDGLLVVYGKCSPDWVQDCVRECRRVEQTKKHRAPVCGVYMAPPLGPKRLKTRYRSLRVINHSNQTELRSYAEAVAVRDVAG